VSELVPDGLELYEPPVPSADDGRDWLRHELIAWPYVTDTMRRFLDALYWRQRAAVVLTYGHGMTQADAAYKLGVSERTVRSDIAEVACLAAGAAQ